MNLQMIVILWENHNKIFKQEKYNQHGVLNNYKLIIVFIN